jgi:transposase
MSQKSVPPIAKPSAERLVRDIRRATRRHYSAEDDVTP